MSDIEQKTISTLKKRIPWLKRLQVDTISYLYREYLTDAGEEWDIVDENNINSHVPFKHWLEWSLSEENPYIKASLAKKAQEALDYKNSYVFQC